MENEKVVLTMTEDGNIVDGSLNEILASDIIITKENIDSLADVETDETRHNDYIEDYDTLLDFYLSNVQKESYLSYIKESIDDKQINDELAWEIKKIVIKQLKQKAIEVGENGKFDKLKKEANEIDGTTLTFCNIDAKKYFENDATRLDELKEGDYINVNIDFQNKTAEYCWIGVNKNPANYPYENDDFKGVLEFLKGEF